MPTFKYTVRDKTGEIKEGTLDGDTKDAVSAKLRSMGYVIVNLDESGGVIASMGTCERVDIKSVGKSTSSSRTKAKSSADNEST